MRFFFFLLITICSFSALGSHNLGNLNPLEYYESIIPEILKGPSEEALYQQELESFLSNRFSFPKEVSVHDAIQIMEYLSQKEIFDGDLARRESLLKEIFHPQNNALDFEHNLLRGYFALVRFDHDNDHSTNLAFEFGLQYLKRYTKSVFNDSLKDPIFLDLWESLQLQVGLGRFHELVHTLASVPAETSAAFFNTKHLFRNYNPLTTLLSFIVAPHRIQSIRDSLTISDIDKLVLQEEHRLKEALSKEASLLPNSFGSDTALTSLFRFYKNVSEFYHQIQSPFMHFQYLKKSKLLEKELAAHSKVASQEAARAMIKMQKLNQSSESESLDRSITALIQRNLDRTNILYKGTVIEVQYVPVPHIQKSDNVILWNSTEAFFKMNIKNPTPQTHQSLVEVAQKLLQRGANLYFDNAVLVPSELTSSPQYTRAIYGRHILIRSAPRSCQLLFGN